MKTLLLFLLLATLSVEKSYCQIIRNGYVNLATLVVDYDTYNFGGGDISYYSCSACALDSIPFSIDYRPPVDFGGVTFTLPSLPDTVFNATIIWSAMGQIYYPSAFSTQNPFTDTSITINIPNDLRYISSDGNLITYTTLLNKADSAWYAISAKKITTLFAASGFKAAIYLYPPASGGLVPGLTKWIVFLYNKSEPNSINNQSEGYTHLQILPNPFSTQLTLSLADNVPTTVSLYNFLGQQLLQQTFTNSTSINTEQLAVGIYFYELRNDKGALKTGKVVKQ